MGCTTVRTSVRSLESPSGPDEKWFSTVLLESAIGLAITDVTGQFIKVNRAFCRITGYSEDELYSRDWLSITHPEDRQRNLALKPALLSGKLSSFLIEKRYLTKSGGTVWVRNSTCVVHGSSGKPEAFVALVEDITERKRAEEALRERDEKFHQMAENIQEIFWVVDAVSKHAIYVNPAFEKLTGRSCESLYENPLSYGEIIHPDDRSRVVGRWEKALRSGNFDEEFRITRADGSIRWAWTRGFPVRDPQGNICRLAGVAQDITERKRAEEALLRLAAIVQSSDDAIISEDLNGVIRSWNTGAQRIFGYTEAEAVGQPDSIVVPPELRKDGVRILRQVRAGEAIHHYETIRLTKSGKKVDVSLAISPLKDVEGRIVGISKIARDITERTQAEAILRESEDRYRDLVENSQELLCTHDLTGQIGSCNPAPARILGYTVKEVLQKNLRDLLAPEFRDQFDEYLARIRKDGVAEGSMVVLSRTGERRVWEYYNTLRTEGVSVPIVRGMARDVTDRKQAERELRASEERFRQLAENIREVFYLTDLQSHGVLYVSPAYEQVWGRPSRNLDDVQESFMCAIHPDDRAVAGQAHRRQTPFMHEYRILRPDGSLRWIWDRRFPIRDKKGRVYRLAGIAEDITERKQAERAFRELSTSLLTLQDQDRRRLARELHDTTAQNLAALVMTLGSLKKAFSNLDQRSRKALTASLTLAKQSAREVRTLSYLLHPPMLDEFGLVDALRWYVRGFRERSGINVQFRVSSNLRRLPIDMETALFRVVQESLHNVQQHSGSKRATVDMRLQRDRVLLEIKDCGREGKAGVPAKKSKKIILGVGIPGMRERLQQFGGELTVDFGREGTVVRAFLPISEKKL